MSDAAVAAAPGTRLGPWRLLRLLGEGGMGQVWLAARADGLYEAEVAIKLLRGDLTGPGLAARFARERALLARLAHPGIARLLDAGQQGERAYLVLEFVPGLTLSEHARGAALPVAARVALLLGVARAVEHAHAQLVVHRDLKPGNVMVTPAGEAKLLDFGVAALLDEDGQGADSLLTRQAGRRVTPAYAAPEQISGAPIGVAADIYALGVMLYELLCGLLPFAAASGSRQALEHAVLHTEPLRLSRTGGAASPAHGPGRPPDFARAAGDLEAIAAKAMRKQPGQRYASVGALIDDLQRWQQHRPVSARKEDWQHRSRLWLRRHAGLALGSALVLLSLGAGLGLSLWQWQRAEAEAQRSRRAVDYLGELLASADPNEHLGRPATVLDLLEKARRELDGRFADDPLLQADLEGVLAGVYHAQGRIDLAITLGEQQLQRLTRLWGADAQRTLEQRERLARIYNAAGLVDRVVELAAPLREPARRLWGEQSAQYSQLLQMLFICHTKLGQFEAAEALLPEMLAVNEHVTPAGSMARVAVLNKIAILRHAQGRYAEAERVIRQAEPAWEAGMRSDPVEVFAQRYGLLTFQMRRMLPRDFEPEVRAYAADAARVLGPNSDPALGLRNELASWWLDRGDYAAAAREREAIAADAAARGLTMPALELPRRARLLLAQTLAARRPAEQLRSDAQTLARELAADRTLSGPNRAEPLLQLARAALSLDPPLAQQLAEQLQALPVMNSSAPLRSRLRQLQGALARQAGDLPLSRELLQQRIAWLDQTAEPDQPPRWRAQLDLATTLVLQGAPEAAAALQRADALRPRGLARHPLDGWRAALGRGSARDAPDGQF